MHELHWLLKLYFSVKKFFILVFFMLFNLLYFSNISKYIFGFSNLIINFFGIYPNISMNFKIRFSFNVKLSSFLTLNNESPVANSNIIQPNAHISIGSS